MEIRCIRVDAIIPACCFVYSASAMRVGEWKLHVNRKPGQEIELFDPAVDPGESNNVSSQHPEVVGSTIEDAALMGH